MSCHGFEVYKGGPYILVFRNPSHILIITPWFKFLVQPKCVSASFFARITTVCCRQTKTQASVTLSNSVDVVIIPHQGEQAVVDKICPWACLSVKFTMIEAVRSGR
jgi:hypothetical protein